jgi:hypothetical protein
MKKVFCCQSLVICFICDNRILFCSHADILFFIGNLVSSPDKFASQSHFAVLFLLYWGLWSGNL